MHVYVCTGVHMCVMCLRVQILTCRGTCEEAKGYHLRVSFLSLLWALVIELRLLDQLSHPASPENVMSTSLFPERLYSFPVLSLRVPLLAPLHLILGPSLVTVLPTNSHACLTLLCSFLLSSPLPPPQLSNLLLRGITS